MSKSTRFGVGGVILATALLVMAIVLTGAAQQPTKDQVNAQQAARDAVTAILLPYAFDSVDLTAGRIAVGPKTDSMKESVAQRLDAVMTQAGSASWKSAINVAIERQARGESNVDLAGGVSSISYKDVKVDGDAATVTGTVKVWQDYADPKSFKVTHGTGWYDFTVVETRTQAGWLVDSTQFEQHLEADPGAIPLP